MAVPTDVRPDWTTVFAEYKTLSPTMRLALRNYAVQRIIERGAEEVGSSDINHSLYGLYCLCGSWDESFKEALENFDPEIR